MMIRPVSWSISWRPQAAHALTLVTFQSTRRIAYLRERRFWPSAFSRSSAAFRRSSEGFGQASNSAPLGNSVDFFPSGALRAAENPAPPAGLDRWRGNFASVAAERCARDLQATEQYAEGRPAPVFGGSGSAHERHVEGRAVVARSLDERDTRADLAPEPPELTLANEGTFRVGFGWFRSGRTGIRT